jgi:hypothetical protein
VNANIPSVLLRLGKLIIHGSTGDWNMLNLLILRQFESGPPTLWFRGRSGEKFAAPTLTINIMDICRRRNVLLQDFVIAGSVR